MSGLGLLSSTERYWSCERNWQHEHIYNQWSSPGRHLHPSFTTQKHWGIWAEWAGKTQSKQVAGSWILFVSESMKLSSPHNRYGKVDPFKENTLAAETSLTPLA